MPRLRLITFNIAHGRGLSPFQGLTSPRKLRQNLRAIARLIERLKPDVVAMQEIDERSRWAGNFDHLDYLRVHAGMPYTAFGINNRRSGLMNLSYGNAILSRRPLMATETVSFGSRRVGEKGFLFAEIDVDGACIPIINLHLQFGSRARRLSQLEHLTAWLVEKQRAHGGRWAVSPIICGDFNSPVTPFDATSGLLDHLGGTGDYSLYPMAGGTFPSPLPNRILDFMVLPAACRHVQCEVVRTMLSDHRPVMVDFGF